MSKQSFNNDQKEKKSAEIKKHVDEERKYILIQFRIISARLSKTFQDFLKGSDRMAKNKTTEIHEQNYLYSKDQKTKNNFY